MWKNAICLHVRRNFSYKWESFGKVILHGLNFYWTPELRWQLYLVLRKNKMMSCKAGKMPLCSFQLWTWNCILLHLKNWCENKLEFSFYFPLRFWQKTSHLVLNSTFRRPRSSNETLISLEVKTNPRYSKFFSACSKSRKVQSEVFCQKEALAHVNIFALQ